MDLPHLRRPFDGARFERALSQEPRQGADRSLGRLRSPDADRLRLRSRAGARRGRQGRRAGQPSRRHARAVRRHSARHHEHLDDHQRHRGVADGALHRGRRRTGRTASRPHRHDPERHHQGVSLARHLRVPAGAVDAADQGRGDLHHDRIAEVESDEHLLLPSSGSRCDAGAGAGFCARHRHRRARHGEGFRRSDAGEIRRGGRADFVLRQCRASLRHRNLQDARLRRAVGRDHPRALRHHRPEAAAVSLRRAGQLAGADRAAAGKQRHPHHDRDAGGDAVEERARPRGAASGLERSARTATAVGSAMVAADAADPRIRDRSLGIRRPVRRLAGDGAQGRRAQARSQGRNEAHRGDGWRRRRGRNRLHEASTSRFQYGAARGDRARRPGRGRRQQISRERGLAADRRPRNHHDGFRRGGGRSTRAAEDLARIARCRRGRSGAARPQARGGRQRQHHAGVDRLRQSRRHHRRMGLDLARGLRRIPRADRRRPGDAQRRRRA